MTLELLTITGHAPAITGEDLVPFTHQLHGYRDGLTYKIPLQGDTPAWLTNYPKINGAATQAVTIKRTFGGGDAGTLVVLTLEDVPPKTITIDKIDMSQPLHGEDPDPAMIAFMEPIARLAQTEKRLTGADVTVHIFKDDVLQDGLALIRDFVVTFAASNDSEGMHAAIEFTAHMEGLAYLDFIEDVTEGAAFSLGASVAVPTGGARTLMLKDLEFALIKVSASGSRDFVEARFTAVSESYSFLR